MKLPDLIKILASQGMRFPARFSVARSGDLWIGTLDPQPALKIDPRRPPRRKKNPDLESLAKEGKKL